MAPVRYALIALVVLIPGGQGCRGPLQGAGRAAWGEPTWGPPAEGLQCRLRADCRIWQPGETPAFTFDLRNTGKRTFAFWPAQKLQLVEIEFDGKWHRWPRPVMIDSHVWPLAPGAQYNAVNINLDKRFGINSTPGKHVVRIAFSLEGVRVVSNPVGIKVLGA
ncbi:MAG: hypothetical protein ACTSWM_07295 [Alphaproteobacteria bacterium]